MPTPPRPPHPSEPPRQKVATWVSANRHAAASAAPVGAALRGGHRQGADHELQADGNHAERAAAGEAAAPDTASAAVRADVPATTAVAGVAAAPTLESPLGASSFPHSPAPASSRCLALPHPEWR